ncbi:MAG: zinc-ribbon domain-containing protein [Bacilli bacterium]
MKYCANCGNEIEEDATFCPNCGARIGQGPLKSKANDDAPSFGFACLGFFFPMIGLILYLVWNNEYPLKAKSCGKGALIGFITSFIIGFCYGIIIIMGGGGLPY